MQILRMCICHLQLEIDDWYCGILTFSWGTVDVDDACNGALYLANTTKQVDPDSLAIDGGSAGGYTTLAVLTFRNIFKAGASHYGIGDLEALVRDTHKFESRYVDTLIGPYPEEKELFKSKSPINYVEKLNCPLALFQGDEDKVQLVNYVIIVNIFNVWYFS